MAKRGYCGIGIVNAKKEVNIGTLWRSAYCLGAEFVFTIGARYHHQCSDTMKVYRHIPYWRFEDMADFREHIPYDCQLVGIEILSDAMPLKRFCHPERAVYLLGPEDGTLPRDVLELCQHIVRFTSKHCVNVSVAGSIVLYDRASKEME